MRLPRIFSVFRRNRIRSSGGSSIQSGAAARTKNRRARRARRGGKKHSPSYRGNSAPQPAPRQQQAPATLQNGGRAPPAAAIAAQGPADGQSRKQVAPPTAPSQSPAAPPPALSRSPEAPPSAPSQWGEPTRTAPSAAQVAPPTAPRRNAAANPVAPRPNATAPQKEDGNCNAPLHDSMADFPALRSRPGRCPGTAQTAARHLVGNYNGALTAAPPAKASSGTQQNERPDPFGNYCAFFERMFGLMEQLMTRVLDAISELPARMTAAVNQAIHANFQQQQHGGAAPRN
ncbi:skin secretory protein xP2 [Schistocerca piceifrons]|uniref:skin secretory protein xP2 n=1 Tax=Schistocerca piceifrons TaxID=274613 RepID=UPI001F5E5185|nr:skin secretory protein xP2 [Schistocerca piceifrons]